MKTNSAEDLYSLLVPLARTRLIVPRACVGEVVGYRPDRAAIDAERPWLIGNMRWGDGEIPVISFEAACGFDMPPLEERVRVVVLRCLGKDLPGGYFGMITQGFPQLVRVNATVLQPDASADWPADSPVVCQLKMINQRPVIPDLERLEQMLVEALRAA